MGGIASGGRNFESSVRVWNLTSGVVHAVFKISNFREDISLTLALVKTSYYQQTQPLNSITSPKSCSHWIH